MGQNEVADVGLVNLMGGLAVERFNDEFARVLANIVDPNTTLKERSITLKVKIKPDSARDLGRVVIDCDSKMAPVRPMESKVFIAITTKGPVATESNPNQPILPGVAAAGGSVTQLRSVGGVS
jgi:hypothetical protein